MSYLPAATCTLVLIGLSPALTAEYETLLLEDSRLDRVGLRRGAQVAFVIIKCVKKNVFLSLLLALKIGCI